MQIKDKQWLCMIGAAMLLIWTASCAVAAEAVPSEDKVAVVNGVVITKSDFDDEMSRVIKRLLSKSVSLGDYNMSAVKADVLESLINRELLLQESGKQGIIISEAEINEQFEKIQGQYPSEGEFKGALDKMNMSEADVKDRVKKEMVLQRYIERAFVQKVTISDKEIKDYYDSHTDLFIQPERVRASHILIRLDPEADEAKKKEAREKINSIREELNKDGDFAALAKKFSQCPSGARGGDLGYFTRGQMVKPFEKVAFSLKPSEISDIVETRFGYHIIDVTDKKPETTIAFQEVEVELGKYLKQQKVNKEISAGIEKLKESAKVERLLKEEDTK